ncbi:hypothetical protein PDIDSM_4899 [Penicillium digitatum]|nr:hypothetical protein PDIDSM_4899 [Penicillium digitatum]
MAEHTKHPEPTPSTPSTPHIPIQHPITKRLGPASIFSEAPEVVSAEHQHKGPVSPCSKTYLPAGQSLISTLYSSHTPPTIHGPPEKQYPDQPDSLGQTQAHDALTPISALPEKAYKDQALSPYSQTQAHLQGCPQQFYAPSGHPSGYATVVPLHCVQSAPCPVDCPVCGKREMTSVDFVNGGTTQ